MTSTTKVKVENFHSQLKSHINNTVIDFNFGRHKDLSTLKRDIHLGLAASVNYHFFGLINPYVYLIEVNNCIMSTSWGRGQKNSTFPDYGHVAYQIEGKKHASTW